MRHVSLPVTLPLRQDEGKLQQNAMLAPEVNFQVKNLITKSDGYQVNFKPAV
jgi:hypothetical protein